jgi:Nif-specific regulatory protein
VKKRRKKSPPPRVDKYSVLLAVADLLSSEVELEHLLRRVLDRVIKVLGAERATLYFVDPRRGEIFSRAAHLPEIREIRLKLGQGVAGYVAKTGESVTLPDSRYDRRFFSSIDEKTGYRTRSMMTLPVKDREGAIFAVFQVLNKKQAPFDRADEEFMQALAGQLGVLLEHTSLYAQIRAGSGGEDIEIKNRFNNIIGESEIMQRLFDTVAKAARTEATVLIRGESGTGKELLARAVHFNGPRAGKPFVKIDCATLPESLIENELFGHARGAYTGAITSHDGKFLRAQGGTVFIDEIGELPLSLQPRLLRILQDREFEQLGGTRTLKVDVRVIAATNRNLEEMVARGLFRQDLYYRIKVVQLHVPPLRERGERDILALASYFLHQAGQKHGRPGAALSAESRKVLAAYGWPGNVRELQNCIESALIMSEGGVIRPTVLNLQAGPEPAARAEWMSEDLTLRQMERAYIHRLLEKHGGNRTRVARILKIGRNTLLRKMGVERWGSDPEKLEKGSDPEKLELAAPGIKKFGN